MRLLPKASPCDTEGTRLPSSDSAGHSPPRSLPCHMGLLLSGLSQWRRPVAKPPPSAGLPASPPTASAPFRYPFGGVEHALLLSPTALRFRACYRYSAFRIRFRTKCKRPVPVKQERAVSAPLAEGGSSDEPENTVSRLSGQTHSAINPTREIRVNMLNSQGADRR